MADDHDDRTAVAAGSAVAVAAVCTTSHDQALNIAGIVQWHGSRGCEGMDLVVGATHVGGDRVTRTGLGGDHIGGLHCSTCRAANGGGDPE